MVTPPPLRSNVPLIEGYVTNAKTTLVWDTIDDLGPVQPYVIIVYHSSMNAGVNQWRGHRSKLGLSSNVGDAIPIRALEIINRGTP